MDDAYIYCPICDDVIPVCNCENESEDFDCETCIVAFVAG